MLFYKRQIRGFDYGKRTVGNDIGSTAIQGIWAKNIVDVMVEISEKATWKKPLAFWNRMDLSKCPMKRDGFRSIKDIPKEGFADKVSHIHLRHTGDNDELYFRDYLNEYPQIAKE